MKTLQWAYSYGFSLNEAEIVTDDELKARGMDMAWSGQLLRGTGVTIDLSDLRWNTVEALNIVAGTRPDGTINPRTSYEFSGCSNRAVEITDEEWDMLLALNAQKKAEKAEKERSNRIAELRKTISDAEKQRKIMTQEEADAYYKRWKDVCNEGGEGYMPTIITREAYDYAKKELDKLLRQAD